MLRPGSMTKVRRAAVGVAAASALAGGLLMNVGHGDRGDLAVEAAEPVAPAPAAKPTEALAQEGVRAEAPGVQVDVDRERGKVSVKQVPVGSEATSIVPPCASTTLFTIASPSPVPSVRVL